MTESRDGYDVAWAVHQTVERLRSGLCPKCHTLTSPAVIRWANGDLVCPNPRCGFRITMAEYLAAQVLVAEIVQRDLSLFEQWQKGESDAAAQ